MPLAQDLFETYVEISRMGSHLHEPYSLRRLSAAHRHIISALSLRGSTPEQITQYLESQAVHWPNQDRDTILGAVRRCAAKALAEAQPVSGS